MASISVSVIVPAYNAATTIGLTLDALVKQDYLQPFEIIVVNDGSTDSTSEVICSYPKIRYAHQDNAGPAAARNRGAGLAQGEFLAFTDSDCLPHADWLRQLASSFTATDIGAVAGSYGIANPQSRLARCVHAEIVWRHKALMPNFPNSFGSYNFCVRRRIFEAVGGFNTNYRAASGEDNDLSYKIVASGQRIYFQRQALVDHYHPVRLSKYLKEQFRHGFWRVTMYVDHPRMAAGDGYTYWKDMAEIPWAGGIALSCILSIFYSFWRPVAGCSAIFFLLLELFCAHIVTRKFFDGIFFGLVLWARALARMFGFSTGILDFFLKKRLKIFK